MYTFRPFGQLESDLNINFGQRSRPELVTQILQECLNNPQNSVPQQDHVWELTVGDRIEALFKIASLARRPEFTVLLNCLHQDCQQKIEVELATQKLVDVHRQAGDDSQVNVSLGEKQLTLRKPTGRDQLRWLENSYPDSPAAIESMIRSLIVDMGDETAEGEFTDEELQIINQTIQEADPLVDFEVTLLCPYCDEAFPYEVNLQEIGLAALKGIQDQLLHEIHRLASNYHWTEHEIAALPHWRREQYLTYLTSESGV